MTRPISRREKALIGWPKVLLLLAVGISILAVCHVIQTDGHGRSSETAVMGNLLTLAYVQEQFREGDHDEDGLLEYATSLRS